MNVLVGQKDTAMKVIPSVSAGITAEMEMSLLSRINFTCRSYFDHFSRLKYYGLYGVGRNIILNAGWSF